MGGLVESPLNWPGGHSRRAPRYFLFTACVLLLVAACSRQTPEGHLQEAQALQSQGKLNAAVIELKNALKKDANFVAGRIALGETYLRSGDYQAALKELERALDLGADAADVKLTLAQTKLAMGRVQEVVGELSELSDRSVEEDILLAQAYLAAGDVPQAAPLFERTKDRAAGMAGLAAIAWQEGNIDEAASLFTQAAQTDPNDAQIWLRLAELELSRGNHEPALQAFTKATKQPAGRLLGEIGQVRTALAMQDLDAAQAGIEGVLELAPNYPLARYLEGLIRYQSGDLASAEAALREVQIQVPQHGPTLYLMGLVKFQQGQLAQAEESLSRYMSQNQRSESVRKLLATVQQQRGNQDAVLETLLPVAQNTRDPQILAMIGTIMLQTGRSAEATAYLERAVELAPDGAAFRNQLALSLLSAGEEERARAELDAAIETDGAQFQSDYLLAMLQLREGKLADAKESVAQIVSKNPDSPVGPNLMGAIAIAERDIDAAVDHFRKALQLDSKFAPARNNLVRLLEQRGDIAAAEQLYAQRLEESPDDDVALLGMAELLARQRRNAEAVPYAKRATVADPDNPRARLALARLHVRSGDQSAALEAVNDGLRADGDNVDLRLMRAELSLRSGDSDIATSDLRDLQSALAAQPDNMRLAFVLGKLQLQAGKVTTAERNFERVVELSAGQNADALLALARISLGQRDYSTVKQRIDALQKLDKPELSNGITLLRADLAAAQGDRAAAGKLYRQLHEAGQREGTVRLAGQLLAQNDSAQGIELLQGWLKNNPTDQAARIVLAGALLADDQAGQAIEEYERLLPSKNAVVLNNLAWLYMEQGDKRAQALALQAYQAAPKNADVADTYGWILLQSGEVDKAVEVLSQSVADKPGNPTSLYHLAAAQQQAGALTKARELLGQALQHEQFPEKAEAQALLAQLQN